MSDFKKIALSWVIIIIATVMLVAFNSDNVSAYGGVITQDEVLIIGKSSTKVYRLVACFEKKYAEEIITVNQNDGYVVASERFRELMAERRCGAYTGHILIVKLYKESILTLGDSKKRVSLVKIKAILGNGFVIEYFSPLVGFKIIDLNQA